MKHWHAGPTSWCCCCCLGESVARDTTQARAWYQWDNNCLFIIIVIIIIIIINNSCYFDIDILILIIVVVLNTVLFKHSWGSHHCSQTGLLLKSTSASLILLIVSLWLLAHHICWIYTPVLLSWCFPLMCLHDKKRALSQWIAEEIERQKKHGRIGKDWKSELTCSKEMPMTVAGSRGRENLRWHRAE